MANLEGQGEVVNKDFNDFTAQDNSGNHFNLKDQLAWSHVMLVFYPGGSFKPVCKSQLCDYRDHLSQFKEFDIKLVCISPDSADAQSEFAEANNYPFTFIPDTDRRIAEAYDCRSVFMLRSFSRAVFIVHKSGKLLYRYVEPTVLTKRGSGELLGILSQMKENGII